MKETVRRLIDDEQQRIIELERRIRRAQQRARQYLKPGTSLVDELLAERRRAAAEE